MWVRVIRSDMPSGHAIVAVDAAGENQIILAPLAMGLCLMI